MQARYIHVSSRSLSTFLPTVPSFDRIEFERSSGHKTLSGKSRTKFSIDAKNRKSCGRSSYRYLPEETFSLKSAADSTVTSAGIVPGGINNTVFDVLVVGGGFAGLAAAAYASSKGLFTLVIEAASLGGHFKKILTTEDHPELASAFSVVEFIKRLETQASAARVLVSREVVSLRGAAPIHHVELDGGETASSRSIVIASGARYGRLNVPNYERFEYKGIHYAATGMEAARCLGQDIVVVGGGNSAGQAAVFLSGTAHHVHLVLRGASIRRKMSSYLVERILRSPHITVHTEAEIEALNGDDVLHEVTWKYIPTGNRETYPVSTLFVMIGAAPRTNWLQGEIELDSNGFIRTGFANPQIKDSLYATSRVGIFAIGDVRSNSIKRITAAISEGIAVADDLRRYLSIGEQLAS